MLAAMPLRCRNRNLAYSWLQTPKHPSIIRVLPRFEADLLGAGVRGKRRAVQATLQAGPVRGEAK